MVNVRANIDREFIPVMLAQLCDTISRGYSIDLDQLFDEINESFRDLDRITKMVKIDQTTPPITPQ